jgi:hypothetical protein
MSSTRCEITGFLCRWCLLGLVAGGGVGLSWASWKGAVAVAASQQACVTVPDLLLSAGAPLQVGGIVSGVAADQKGLILASVQGRHELYRLWNDRAGGFFGGTLAGTARGRTTLRCIGAPYGGAAFCQDSSLIVALDPRREVFLIDASLAIRALSDRPAALHAVVRLLGRRGEVAFVHEASPAAFLEVRRTLKAQFPLLPLAWRPTAPLQTGASAWSVARSLKRTPAASGLTLIAEDIDLVEAAAKRGMHVEWIAAGNRAVRYEGNVRRQASLDAYELFLVRRGTGR